MSAAESKLEIERHDSSQNELAASNAQSLESKRAPLAELSAKVAKRVIAVDLDDVLCETNAAVAEWHNKEYGTCMTLETFYYYYYWKNPYWGDLRETFEKVKRFYETNAIYEAEAVPGAHEGVRTLRDMGYKLIIVTARSEDAQDQSWKWVNENFPDIFDSIVCTGQFKDANKYKDAHEVTTSLSKAQVCEDLKAVLLIDDSAENALQTGTATNATPVLLFGEYEWNKRMCRRGDAQDAFAFSRRLEAEGGREFWKEESLNIPIGTPLWRVKDWKEVVDWVEERRSEGLM